MSGRAGDERDRNKVSHGAAHDPYRIVNYTFDPVLFLDDFFFSIVAVAKKKKNKNNLLCACGRRWTRKLVETIRVRARGNVNPWKAKKKKKKWSTTIRRSICAVVVKSFAFYRNNSERTKTTRPVNITARGSSRSPLCSSGLARMMCSCYSVLKMSLVIRTTGTRLFAAAFVNIFFFFKR